MNISFTFSHLYNRYTHIHTNTPLPQMQTDLHISIIIKEGLWENVLYFQRSWERLSSDSGRELHFSLRRAATCFILNCLELIIKTKQLDADIIRSIHTFLLNTVDICLQPMQCNFIIQRHNSKQFHKYLPIKTQMLSQLIIFTHLHSCMYYKTQFSPAPNISLGLSSHCRGNKSYVTRYDFFQSHFCTILETLAVDVAKMHEK